MICPECGSEYRDGFTRCSDCDLDLVEPELLPAEEPDVKLVKVYETGNPALIPLLQSLFDGAGVEFMLKGDAIQDLFGWGRIGARANFITGPVEFHVREDKAAEAQALVDSVEQSLPLVEGMEDDLSDPALDVPSSEREH
jgi:hypothetical protein